LLALGLLTGLAAEGGEVVVGPFSSATPGGALPFAVRAWFGDIRFAPR
jgi:hypothetical protein